MPGELAALGSGCQQHVQVDWECWGGQAALAPSCFLRWPGKQFVLDDVFAETHFVKGPAAALDSSLNFSVTLRGDESNDIK